jgi:sterol desaturase/sphingolipid hydroxylase (fatty acid hydroxylase superfamily)
MAAAVLLTVALPAALGGRVEGSLAWGLASVAAAQAVVVAYHWYSRGRRPPVQPGRVPVYRFSDGLADHLGRPEGLALLACYLVGTWTLGWLPTRHYQPGAVEWARVAAALAIVDALQWAAHRAEHSCRLLYRGHKPHHRFVSPRLFDAFHGSAADTAVMVLLPLLGASHLVPLNTWSYAAFGAVFSSQLTLIHAEYHHPWDGWFRRLGIGTPADHHVHHVRLGCNFGHCFTWWDRAAGTYVAPDF